MKIAEIRGARKPVVTVPVTAGVAEVTSLMRRHNIGAVVVVDDGVERLRVVGLITEREVAWAVGTAGAAVVNLTAGQLMTAPVLTCSPDDRVAEVMQTMLQRRVRHLPLMEDGKLVGMVSVGDVMKNQLEMMELEANVLRDLYRRTSARF